MMVNNHECDTSITKRSNLFHIMKIIEYTRFNVLARNSVPLRLAIDG
jgi:hypothetical protein